MLFINFNESDIKNIGSNSTILSNHSNCNIFPNDENYLNNIKNNERSNIDQTILCLTSKFQNLNYQ
ncbi:hypothetical protein DDB_G0282403 [Dictyostelium discoideum AX4]|uniref:Uncharacterized protein n=1 Tax=Dictyostelium discoideum TaxID=44689 RepID=Q54SL2_DICDI|nr:hypothetical protein DDB_G0282403 [Dictyostelium discoideum AX4]EAL66061.1 hypothetical protein DDB_G0282403 [Dictyostelium discoideum AX4]|eukprot:XP_640027.1 hypothetical protein DDB_G0282403 [Dictyostelium discoideum AX4]